MHRSNTFNIWPP